MLVTIKAKLLAVVAALAVCVVAVGATGWLSARHANQMIRTTIVDRVQPLEQLRVVGDSYAVDVVDAAWKARSGQISMADAAKRIDGARVAIRAHWSEYRATPLTPDEAKIAVELGGKMIRADQDLVTLKSILESGDMAALTAFTDQELYKDIDPITTTLGDLADLQIKLAEENGVSAERYAHKATLVMAGLAGIVLLCVGYAFVFVTRSVSRPLDRLADAMGVLAGGDLAVEVPSLERQDEVGQMGRAVQVFKDNGLKARALEAEAEGMRAEAESERGRTEAERRRTEAEQAMVVKTLAASLERLAQGDLTARIEAQFDGQYRQIKSDFNSAIDSLREAMVSISTATGGIRGGANEIASASNDLARRTEQQAASLEETAAALDQITANVRSSAEGARLACDAASGAKVDAERSGQVMEDAVAAMSEIEQSSGQITNIIGVIDEIAFQTNLLALNAGVEAARAGDAGKGFAVVAQEVRALAQRSAEAAKEIKTLIANSSSQVSRGVRLVGDTGQALGSIVARVNEIDQLIAAISQSSQEQATGLSQVNTAINQMDQVTQQNAAMVEEATAAAANLRTETGSLARLVGRFDVGGDEGRALERMAA